jgi:hypothetical protein
MWYNNISYVTGGLYNMLLCAVCTFCCSVSGLPRPGCTWASCVPVVPVVWPGLLPVLTTWLLWACSQTGHSYIVACCIAADWETWSRWLASQSARPIMVVEYQHGLRGRHRGETLADLRVYDCQQLWSESKVWVKESARVWLCKSKNLRFKN